MQWGQESWMKCSRVQSMNSIQPQLPLTKQQPRIGGSSFYMNIGNLSGKTYSNLWKCSLVLCILPLLCWIKFACCETQQVLVAGIKCSFMIHIPWSGENLEWIVIVTLCYWIFMSSFMVVSWAAHPSRDCKTWSGIPLVGIVPGAIFGSGLFSVSSICPIYRMMSLTNVYFQYM